MYITNDKLQLKKINNNQICNSCTVKWYTGSNRKRTQVDIRDQGNHQHNDRGNMSIEKYKDEDNG